MKNVLRISGITFAVLVASWSWSEAQAGRHRGGASCEHVYASPAPTYSASWYTYSSTSPAPVVADSNQVNGRQRYQSAYQAPAAPNTNVYYAPVQSNTYYNGYNNSLNEYNSNGHSTPRFMDRSFEEQFSADRKIRGL